MVSSVWPLKKMSMTEKKQTLMKSCPVCTLSASVRTRVNSVPVMLAMTSTCTIRTLPLRIAVTAARSRYIALQPALWFLLQLMQGCPEKGRRHGQSMHFNKAWRMLQQQGTACLAGPELVQELVALCEHALPVQACLECLPACNSSHKQGRLMSTASVLMHFDGVSLQPGPYACLLIMH